MASAHVHLARDVAVTESRWDGGHAQKPPQLSLSSEALVPAIGLGGPPIRWWQPILPPVREGHGNRCRCAGLAFLRKGDIEGLARPEDQFLIEFDLGAAAFDGEGPHHGPGTCGHGGFGRCGAFGEAEG